VLPASPKLCIDLGRHRSPRTGLWIHGRNFIEAFCEVLAEGQRTAPRPSLVIRTAGPASLRDELLAVLGGKDFVTIMHEESEEHERRWGIFRDFFTPLPGGRLTHCNCNVASLFPRGELILTVHDLLQAFPVQAHGSFFARLKTWWYRGVLASSIKKAKVIVAVHPRVKEEILRRYAGDKRIEVIYPTLDRAFLTASMVEIFGASSFLAFASEDARKNIDVVLDAFALAGKGAALRIIASSKKVEEALKEKIHARNLGSSVSILRNVPTSEMPKLYQESSGLIFPSLAEGFGYPLYEALSQGTPVICDPKLIVPELQSKVAPLVYGAAANESGVRDALERLRREPPEKASRQAAAKAVRELLDSQAAARRVLNIYNDLLGEAT
jgi:glycosyltransferase involved in cell wall biosynthesis